MLSFRSASLVAVITVVVGLLFLLTPLGEGIRHASYDIPFALRRSVPVGDAVIVTMDEASRHALGLRHDERWPRSLHATLVNKLTSQGARAIVFDVLFDQPSADRSTDEALAQAIKAHGRVVLAAAVVDRRFPGGMARTSELPTESLLSSAASVGMARLLLDSDSKVRRHFESRSNMDPPSLANALMTSLGKPLPTSDADRWLNFYGPAGTVPWCSYQQVLVSNGLPAQLLNGKVVFVGQAPMVTAHGIPSDVQSTPVGNLPGVEIQATAFLNLWRHDWLTELPTAMECVLMVIVACLFGYACGLSRPRTAIVLALAGMVLVSWGSCLLAWHPHLWFPWLIVAGVQIPCAAVCSILGLKRGLNRQPEIPFES